MALLYLQKTASTLDGSPLQFQVSGLLPSSLSHHTSPNNNWILFIIVLLAYSIKSGTSRCSVNPYETICGIDVRWIDKRVNILVFSCCSNKLPPTLVVENNTKLFYYILEVRSPKMGQQGCVPAGGSREEPISLTLRAARGYLHLLACGPLLRLKSTSLQTPIIPYPFLYISDFDMPASLL